MGQLDRYILSQLLAVWGLASLVLVLVYWINRAVAVFDQLIADGQGAGVFLEFTALALPAIIRLVLPLAAFGAALWAVNRMGGDSEVTVAQAAGLSPWRLARPVLVFGLIVAAVVAVLAHVLAPAAAQRLAARQAEIAATATARLLREGEFVSPAPGLTLYVRDVTAEGELRDLLLSDGRDEAQGVTYTAASAYLVRGPAGPQLVMVDGLIQRLGRADGRLLTTAFADLAYDLGPLMGASAAGRRSLREVPTGALLRPTPALLAATERDAAALRAEAHGRLAEPFLAPAAALLAFAALMQAPWGRMGARGRVLVAVAGAIAVQGVDGAASAAIGDDPGLWPLAYLAPALGAAAAGALLWRAGRAGRMVPA